MEILQRSLSSGLFSLRSDLKRDVGLLQGQMRNHWRYLKSGKQDLFFNDFLSHYDLLLLLNRRALTLLQYKGDKSYDELTKLYEDNGGTYKVKEVVKGEHDVSSLIHPAFKWMFAVRW